MKSIVRGLALLTCICTSAGAFTRLGQGAELFATGQLGVRSDDNIFLSDLDTVDDTILEFAPGLRLSFGQGAQLTGQLAVAESFTRHLDNDQLDDELFSAVADGTINGAKLESSFAFSFRELNQSTRDVRGASLIRRDATAASLDSRVSLTAKTAIGAGVMYGNTEYKDRAYFDIREITVPVNYYYGILEKLDLSAGLRLRDSAVARGGEDSRDLYYNVGARGDFTPKLSGYFSVGFNQRRRDVGADESSVGADARLTYVATEKTKLEVTLIRDYATGAEGLSQESFTVSPVLTVKLTEQWEAVAALTFQQIDYFTGRSDDYIDARIGLGYRINRHASLDFGYNLRSNQSSESFRDSIGRRRSADFDNSVISVAASLQY